MSAEDDLDVVDLLRWAVAAGVAEGDLRLLIESERVRGRRGSRADDTVAGRHGICRRTLLRRLLDGADAGVRGGQLTAQVGEHRPRVVPGDDDRVPALRGQQCQDVGVLGPTEHRGVLGISFFASVGMLVWGRVTHHPQGARLGFDGLMVCLVAAIIYVVGYVIITSITGNGC